jgi:hypothetical protein
MCDKNQIHLFKGIYSLFRNSTGSAPFEESEGAPTKHDMLKFRKKLIYLMKKYINM